jgi:phenylpropionate dioxygenase-like ring-hydroxylating dioxygenase large terminal subunit
MLVMSKAKMLECPPAMGMPRNQWYVGAFSSEVGRTPLKRQLLGDRVVFFRTEGGVPAALADRCPHRGLPLSMGVLEGDALRCGYHGMVFGPTGTCMHIPSQTMVPDGLGVHSYPLVEKSVWIWIWMGDPQLADPALIPDHAEIGLDTPGYEVTEMFRMDIPGNYQLLHENLLDVSHITYLHPGMLDDGSVGPARTDVRFAPDRITIAREVEEIANRGTAFAFSLQEGERYHRTLVTWTMPPALSVISNTYVDLEQPDAPPHVLISPFGITPATATTTHQFVVTATSYPGKQPQAAIDYVWQIFEQDNVAIKAIQTLYQETGTYGPEFSVKVDAAALRCRLRNAELGEREFAVA